MKKTALRATAVLVLIVVVMVTLFITVVSAKEPAAAPEIVAAEVQAQDNGSIRGTVFYDSNYNGVMDSGEAGMPDVTVTLSSSSNWSFAYTTGSDGTYGPAGLSHGHYSAQLTVPYGYMPTTATHYNGLEVSAEKPVITGVNFGLNTGYYWPPNTGGPPVVAPPIYYPPVAVPPIYYPPVPVHPIEPPPADCSYVVQPGDSLGEIAVHYGTTVSALASLNNISNPNLIYPGQVLTLPGCTTTPPPTQPPATTTYVVVRGDTLYSIAVRHGTTVSHLQALNGISNPDLIYTGQVLIVPVV
jgi:LysM repeat protein